ncbi:o-succinylbenzoate synthase [Aquiflexum sp.]|uniref:o-succinylbenzoate synthase n=1 Tax=Aquiflexum sp. TaxID=1872584 RepID=UPI003592ED1C
MTEVLKDIQFTYVPHLLQFKFEAGTSRGVLTDKKIFLLKAYQRENPQTIGWGEAAPLVRLSIDDIPDFETHLENLCKSLTGLSISKDEASILDWVNNHIPSFLPSIRFAFETALLDLWHNGNKLIFDTSFFNQHKSIPINGLIWMGTKDFMLEQIDKKLNEGFTCIKMKIGAIDFDRECDLLGYIRQQFDASQITLRVDANGAFTPDDAMLKLDKLASFDLHSIEQPIKQGQMELMAELCGQTPLPIALDEELIGMNNYSAKRDLLEKIKPQYIIIKPTLLGGIAASHEWIALAENMGIGWWVTSALESNIGLNAIAQFTSTYQITMPQGLGTGQLYSNNFDSPLTITNGYLEYNVEKSTWKVGF